MHDFAVGSGFAPQLAGREAHGIERIGDGAATVGRDVIDVERAVDAYDRAAFALDVARRAGVAGRMPCANADFVADGEARRGPGGEVPGQHAAIGAGRVFEITYSPPSYLASWLAVPLGGLAILLVAFGAWTLRGWPRVRPAGAGVTLTLKGGPLQGLGIAEPESAAAEASYARALVNLERRRDFRMHLVLYVAWTAFLAVIWIVSEHERTNSWPGPFKREDATLGWNPWIAYPVFGWGLIVAFHAFVTYRQPVTRDDVEQELGRLRG